tara:strand:+ start:506 stop:766 length:261 start_codon:yes stop_codon:yes gene_type:complete
MKKYLIILLFTFIYQNNLIAEEKKDCSELKKWSSKMACKTKMFTGGVKKAGNSVLPEKMKIKKFTIIPKAFSEKKTLADFFKKKEK